MDKREGTPNMEQALADEQTRNRVAHYQQMAADAAAMTAGPTFTELAQFVALMRGWERGLRESYKRTGDECSWGQAIAYKVAADCLVGVYGVPE
jgi:hypothetical protein